MNMDTVITELSIGNVSPAQLEHIAAFVTCEPPSCSQSELWRLRESACELEENEYGCTKHKRSRAKLSDMLKIQ